MIDVNDDRLPARPVENVINTNGRIGVDHVVDRSSTIVVDDQWHVGDVVPDAG